MAYNGLTAWIQFQEEQKRQREEYAAAGMSPEAIDAICKYDEMVFKRDDAYKRHRTELPTTEQTKDFSASDDSCKWIYRNISALSHNDKLFAATRYGWIAEIDNDLLRESLAELTDEELEILTELAFDDDDIQVIARQYGQSRFQIYRKITKIKKVLEKAHILPSPNTLQ